MGFLYFVSSKFEELEDVIHKLGFDFCISHIHDKTYILMSDEDTDFEDFANVIIDLARDFRLPSILIWDGKEAKVFNVIDKDFKLTSQFYESGFHIVINRLFRLGELSDIEECLSDDDTRKRVMNDLFSRYKKFPNHEDFKEFASPKMV